MKKSIFYLIHTIIVVLFVILALWSTNYTSSHFKEPFYFSFIDSFIFYGSLLGLTYFSYWLFIPKFLVQKKYWKFFFGMFGIVFGYVGYFCALAVFLASVLNLRFHLTVTGLSGSMLFFAFFLGMAGTFFRLFVEWLKDAYSKIELEKQNFKSELSLLKNQLNPHFLFNTLNNIDSLIIEKSPNASLALNKLSEIMRYMVYDSEKEFVPLKDEIGYIENYISLQKLRIQNEAIIQFSVTGDITSKQIVPMLFIPFVENAFKHSSLKDKPENKIDIRITVTGDQLSFYCSNIVSEIKKDTSSGVGLGIVKKRLQLIYKNNYKLNIERKDPQYVVTLDLKI